ncbi:serine carboxypeptidase-like 22 isoform X2 [Physcomitrium patens]|uniref:Carboxypeptidase n=1 Tax=Physcomitrium patens TaxID=3218 RepID=A0A2K1KIT6_PHYPA|nr:serine carboxypeptidase-like 22 isoform X2 [Physcomitrium patens]PNR53696.1 hypothetical protein PHYPA_007371 [Physcomitrium patens]|eukprot:XP_024375470.1 serine carboxypeptidase-like 22 isoform X2 [Physcomitrella patens]
MFNIVTLPVMIVFVLMFLESIQGILEHAVKDLPGQPPVNFSQYAGYIDVGETKSKHLFYWFVEADNKSPSSLPIAFWFNGGPGCSSVGDGLLTELGPFRVSYSGNLTFNEHSWNKEANVVFVESPVAVGFSYSNKKSDYAAFSDAQTATDAYSFLVNWFTSYPEYLKNDMYIIGESYGGHYVPQLVQQVVKHNKSPGAQFLNLKGFAVGNAWTDAYFDNKGSIDYFHSHSLISDETYKSLIDNCDLGHEFPIDVPNTSAKCNNATLVLYNMDLSGLNVYNIYGPSCNLPYNNVSTQEIMNQKTPSFPASAAIDPCLDYVTPYLNKADVKRALHVSPDIEWTECSNTVFNKYAVSDILSSMLPVYRELLQTGLRIMVYSGDFDGRVPTTGTRAWISQLGIQVKKPWYPWVHGGPRESNTGGGQVSGYAQVYEKNFTFSTVRAAGHLVPADQPKRALALFHSFLTGKPLEPFEYPARP